jgi:ketosteroid isomerase-like protein
MRTIAAFAVLLLVAACQAPPAEMTEAEISGAEAIQEVIPLFEAYTAGMVGGDAQSIAALYTADPVEMTPGSYRNRADIIAHYEGTTARFDFSTWDFEPIDAWIHGDAAYVISHVNITQTDEGGVESLYELYSTMRLVREAGQWKIDRNVVGQR